jgi:hypothetical protein
MSWSVSMGGTGEQVSAAAEQKFDQTKQYPGSEPHHEVVDALAAATKAFAERFPDAVVVMESSGHLDAFYGNASLTLKVVPKAS